MIGKFILSMINLMVMVFGKRVSLLEHPWLVGPMSDEPLIGDQFYQRFAKQEALSIRQDPDIGLVDDFSEMIQPSDPHAGQVNPRVAHFYEHTAQYKIDIWTQWFSIFAPFGKLFIKLASPQQQQLNLPLDALSTSYGMASQIIRLSSADGATKLTVWQRKMIKTGQIVFAGFYSHCQVASSQKHFLRATFPLPKGNVTVLLEAVAQPDGSVKVISNGKRLGESGYYRLRKSKPGYVKIMQLPIHEVIHVFEDQFGVLRTDHVFTYFGIKLMHLHYKMVPAVHS